MRFVRSEYSLSVITDKKIEEKKDVVDILNNLQKYNVEFKLSFRKFFITDYVYKEITHDKVRISKINHEEETVDLISFDKKCSLIMRNIKIEDLIEIKATTAKNNILGEYVKMERWDLLDFEPQI